jgi:ComF family protein
LNRFGSAIKAHLSLFGQDCVLCGAALRNVESSQICARCEVSLPVQDGDTCPQCAIPGADKNLCGACLACTPYFDATVAAFVYRFPIDRLLQNFKYAANLSLAAQLADKLIRAIRARREPFPAALIPMPLARLRLAERGFNQAALVAQHVASELNIPIQRFALERIRETVPQTTLPWKARHANIKGAFACRSDIEGRHVAVLDDVMTTGATMNEAAKVLKQRGASRVTAWVVARAQLDLDAGAWESEPLGN